MEASKERYGLNENLLMFSPVIKKSECWEKIRQEQIKKETILLIKLEKMKGGE